MGAPTPDDPEVAVAQLADAVSSDDIPDIASKVGYLDDAWGVEIVWNRIDNARNAFGAARD